MLSVLIFLAVLSVLVVGHELGHFIMAKLVGIKTEEFGYGFPPRAIGWVKVQGVWRRLKRGDKTSFAHTIWSINWLPLGGFVRLKGEQGENTHDTDAFLSKPVWARIAVLVAGVFMNWFMAVVIFSAGFMVGVPVQTDVIPRDAIVRDQHVMVADVLQGAPAERAGIKTGDIVLRIALRETPTVAEAQHILAMVSSLDVSTPILIERDGKQQELLVTPALVQELGKKGIGVALSNTGIMKFPWYRAIEEAISLTLRMIQAIAIGIAGIVTRLVSGQSLGADVSGPVGIAVMTGGVASQGFWPLMQFSAMLSLNLAVINILPIPALDGGRTLFALFELFRRKRVNETVELVMHQIGFIVLLILVALVTIRDVQHYGGTIWLGFKSIIGL